MNSATRKNIASAIITLLILGGAGFIATKMSSQKKSSVSDRVVKKERRKVKVASFAPSTVSNDIAIDGRLSAHDRVNITSKVTGVMKARSNALRAGRYYKKGDLLFDIDQEEATYNLKAQKSQLMTAITQMMPDLKFDYPTAFANWQQYLDGFDVNQSLKPLPEAATVQERYFISGKNILTQFYNIKSLETRLRDYTIRAPFSGVITQLNAFPGALISPGQALATMINTSTYEIEAPIPLEQLQYIKPGQTVDLTSTELNKTWKGRVSRIGTIIDPNTQYLPVYISVGGAGLKDGMYLKGSIDGNSLNDVIQLPKDIFLSPNSIYVVQDSTLVVKEVVPVKRSASHVMVSGLKGDEKIVVGAQAGLFIGQKVDY